MGLGEIIYKYNGQNKRIKNENKRFLFAITYIHWTWFFTIVFMFFFIVFYKNMIDQKPTTNKYPFKPPIFLIFWNFSPPSIDGGCSGTETPFPPHPICHFKRDIFLILIFSLKCRIWNVIWRIPEELSLPMMDKSVFDPHCVHRFKWWGKNPLTWCKNWLKMTDF